MKSLIRNLFQRKPLKPPQSVIKRFTDSFYHSKNIEWSKAGRIYEALFYEDEIEKIARFDRKGNLIELRTNISPAGLPEIIYTVAKNYGELMNVICIKRDQQIFYEIIVRENALNRYLLLLNQQAAILKKEKL